MKFEDQSSWLSAAGAFPQNLASIDRSQPDGGLRTAILAFWRLIEMAPDTVKQLYSDCSEAQYLEWAAGLNQNPPTLFADPCPTGDDPRKVMRWAAVNLRRLEMLFVDLDLGTRAVDPQKDWLIEWEGRKAFFVPLSRRAWREVRPPENDKASFDKRGLKHVRILPAKVDGAEVRMIQVPWRPSSGSELTFGAALFPKIKFSWDEDDDSFLVTRAVDANAAEVIAGSLERAHTDRCVAVIFPELTIDPESLKRIERHLKTNNWRSLGPPPAIVLAGSWHVQEGQDHFNLASVLTGYGKPLIEGGYRKRLFYRDEKGKKERITPGKELPILVLDDGLFTFGICLDFATKSFPTIYDDLDVDFVLVTSCGNAKTMRGHIATSQSLDVRRHARAFVVQQRYPRKSSRTSAGYVLAPGVALEGLTPLKVQEKASWNLSRTPRRVAR